MNLLLVAAAYREAADEAERKAHRAAYHKHEETVVAALDEKRRCKAIENALLDLFDAEVGVLSS